MTEPEVTASLEPAFRKQVGEYLRELADQLGIRDWTLQVMHDEPSREIVGAAVQCVYGQREAEFKFRRDFPTHTPEVQRSTLIHELVHIPFEQARQYADEVLPDLLGKPASLAFMEAWRQLNEHAVDHIARTIAPGFPLPPWAPETCVVDHQ